MIGRLFAIAVLALFPALVNAQVLPSGTFTPGHTLKALNATGTAVGDAGGAAGGAAGTGLTELGITATGLPFCINDGPTTGPYHQICLGANALGGGLISFGANNGASQTALNIAVNGTTYPFPGPGTGTVLGPSSTTIGNVWCSANTVGTLTKECGTGITITTAATATAGVSAKVDNLFDQNSAGTPAYIGTNFGGTVYIQTAFGNKLNSSMTGSGTNAGYFGFLSALQTGGYSNNQANGVAVPLASWVNVTNTGDHSTALNIVASAGSGITPGSMGGSECDLQANSGATISAGVGTCYFAYAYNKTYNNGYFVGTGDSGTGKFTNGFVIGNSSLATTGVGLLFGGSTQTIGTGIDFGSASVTFSTAALHLYTSQKLKFDAGGGTGISNQYIDGSGNLRLTVPNTGTSIVIRDSTDANTVVQITNGGAILMTGELTSGSTTLMATSVSLTNGSGASTGTLTNAPAAGNPTKWIGINDNGTTRFVPSW